VKAYLGAKENSPAYLGVVGDNGGMSVELSVLEFDDPMWTELTDEYIDDPYCSRPYLAATERGLGRRPVLVLAQAREWRAVYPVVLEPVSRQRFLARTPDYGGPWIDAVDVDAAASEFRSALDELLPSLGVISEVILLSPWLPGRDSIATRWQCLPEKLVVLLDLGMGVDSLHLTKGRRSDLGRARREASTEFHPLDPDAAAEFSRYYAAHMNQVDGAVRWRLGPEFFRALALASHEEATISWARRADGGAASLFLRSGAHAAYAFSTRWGNAGTAATLSMWTAFEELARGGVREVLLGGGLTSRSEDSLLSFKRSWGGQLDQIFIAARAFDRYAHERLVAAGSARPLPIGTIDL
jgi:hypothetical protein